MKDFAVLLCNGERMGDVYPEALMNRMKELCEVYPVIITRDTMDQHREALKKAKYVFSTWGMVQLSEEEIKEYLPSLEAVFYGAGSVQQFARPYLNCGIKVFSAWAANAVPVAEYATAQIVLGGKGFFLSCRRERFGGHAAAKGFSDSLPCNYNIKVGILGAGMIGKMMLERLRAYEYEVLVYDPFVSEEIIESYGAKKASLEEIFSTCQVISNHVANLPSTVGMITTELLSSMLPNACFINTGRGATVDENGLIAAMEACPDRCAVLDVTWPEPPEKGSKLYTLPNIFLTPHIAGSLGQEVARMGKYMLDECEKVIKGEPTQYEVTLKMLETMA